MPNPPLGAKAGEDRTVSVKFPENYGAKNLAVKDAEFAVTVKSVKAPNDVACDDRTLASLRS